jgi:acetyl-CoA/propionyl-CoA carboxylase biotin carboxyl carrier protein
MFDSVLVANRGEIAVRVIRTCRDLGVRAVAMYSDADEGALHVRLADEAVHLPGVAPAETYLNVPAVVEAAEAVGVQAVHPGYGFLSERADAAEAVAAAGLVWVGPPPEAIRAVGDKIRARRLAEEAGVASVPGTLEPVRDRADVLAFAETHGFPVAIKAAGGGGGRGLKVAHRAEEVDAAWESAVREAVAYFGSEDVYLERYLERPKHLEVQILAPRPGRAIALGVRDCSMQRRHQKLVEETPPPRHAELAEAMGNAAAAVADVCGYANAGTVEFLVDDEGAFFFLEVNARLQVEHTVTEEVLGIDLVACQLRIAAGEDPGLPADLAPRGHAIECRINAEDPAQRFLPGPGRITRWVEPGGPGVRVDEGYREGDEVPAAYDSLLAKLVVLAPSREEARRRALRALDDFVIEGVPTTIPAHRILLEHAEFVAGDHSTRTVESGALDALVPPLREPRPSPPARATVSVGGQAASLWNPAIAASIASGGGLAAADGSVVAPMHGTVLKVLVAAGDEVGAGAPVAVLEAMKMETVLVAPVAGRVAEIAAEPGAVVEASEVVARIEPAPAATPGGGPTPSG